jgi:hypothetical protein
MSWLTGGHRIALAALVLMYVFGGILFRRLLGIWCEAKHIRGPNLTETILAMISWLPIMVVTAYASWFDELRAKRK